MPPPPALCFCNNLNRYSLVREADRTHFASSSWRRFPRAMPAKSATRACHAKIAQWAHGAKMGQTKNAVARDIISEDGGVPSLNQQKKHHRPSSSRSRDHDARPGKLVKHRSQVPRVGLLVCLVFDHQHQVGWRSEEGYLRGAA
jgi:hypothetical protein